MTTVDTVPRVIMMMTHRMQITNAAKPCEDVKANTTHKLMLKIRTSWNKKEDS